MGLKAKILDSFIGNDGEPSAKVEIYKGDNATARIFNPPGVDARPLDGDACYSVDSQDSEGGKDVLGFINDPGSEKGEVKVFSRSGPGTLIAELYLDKTGKISMIAPSNVEVDTDVIAALVSLVNHHHIDSWGKPTSKPIPTGTPDPAIPATVTIDSDIDTATNSKKIDGKQFLSHTHPITSGSSSPGPTGGVS